MTRSKTRTDIAFRGAPWKHCAFAVVLLGASCEAGDVDFSAQPVETASAPSKIVATTTTRADTTAEALFAHVIQKAKSESLSDQPLGNIIQSVGQAFLGASYVGGMLDAPEEEELVVSLDKFDCVLYVEVVLAISRGISVEDFRFSGFADRLREQRYRGGEIDGYCSRLHYFTEWIADNERRGIVEDITRELGGVMRTDTLNFMSEHRNQYVKFATNDSLYRGIQEMEQRLATLELWYIPQSEIESTYDRLRPGDIIGTSTNIAGLDVSHTGFAFVKSDKTVGFLHASTSGGVKISPDLASYVADHSIMTGVVVARPVDAR